MSTAQKRKQRALEETRKGTTLAKVLLLKFKDHMLSLLPTPLLPPSLSYIFPLSAGCRGTAILTSQSWPSERELLLHNFSTCNIASCDA